MHVHAPIKAMVLRNQLDFTNDLFYIVAVRDNIIKVVLEHCKNSLQDTMTSSERARPSVAWNDRKRRLQPVVLRRLVVV